MATTPRSHGHLTDLTSVDDHKIRSITNDQSDITLYRSGTSSTDYVEMLSIASECYLISGIVIGDTAVVQITVDETSTEYSRGTHFALGEDDAGNNYRAFILPPLKADTSLVINLKNSAGSSYSGIQVWIKT